MVGLARALLRSAGFPAAGLDRFAAPECAAAADDFLDGQGRVLLPAARWLSATLGDAFDAAFSELYDELFSSPDDGVPMTVFTEMLPGTEDAWLPDQSGQGYFSELRSQLVDPLPARGTGPGLPTLAP